jgi:transglutaminase-like putative cysteine protease
MFGRLERRCKEVLPPDERDPVDGMTWRISVAHTTTHRYAQEVFNSYNEARMVPQSFPGQFCLESRVTVSPGAKLFRYTDYWGSLVDSFDIHAPHTILRVDCRSTVETSNPVAESHGMSWEDLRSSDVADKYAELLATTKLVPSFREEAEAILSDTGSDPAAAARAAVEWVNEKLIYETGSTDVTTPADKALRNGKGVCQDFAHLSLGVLRSLGIPSRYVSGYLHPHEEPVIGETVEGQGHAWVEWWCGSWTAWDPSHAQPAGQRHVVVGRGRDYSDLPPLKGIYQGAPSIAHEVEVAITRTA